MTTTPIEAPRIPKTKNRGFETAAQVEVRRFDPATDSARDDFVRSSSSASVFHLAGWRRAVERTFGHDPRDLVAWQEGRVVGVLPLFACRSPFGKRHLISTPYGVYGGAIGETEEIERALSDAAVAMAKADGVGRLELRCLRAPSLDLVPSDLYATFIQPLPETTEEVWTRMPKRARAEVRKAIERHGLVLCEGEWYLDDLFEMFHDSKKGLGSPGLPKRWFENLKRELGDACVVHLARTPDMPIAATMSFVIRDTIYFYYVGTIPDANRNFNATNYLVTRLQEWGVARHLKFFDLGRSRVGSGPYEFKKHQGFEPTPLHYRYALVKSASLPSFNPSNPKTERLRTTWTKLPSWMTKSLSSALMRYLP
ncbi:MAG: FemAB family PEP-CTERM system-associated protein [Planctomycetes bacterium]|nr:FemAB family PEP-CTERM system-associated protein [Planctomycetota bacterium]